MAIKPNANKSLNSSSVQIMNAIRNGASQTYRDYVPYATSDLNSIREIGGVIMQSPALQNEFLEALVNRIGRVLVTNKMYRNPWAIFKAGILELGESIEEIFVDIAKPFEYDVAVSEREIFKREIPDVKAAFHILNFQKFYKTTVESVQLRQAFLSWGGITDLISKIVESMYSGANYDEFITMKYLLARHIVNGHLYPKQVSSMSAANAKSIVSTIKGISNKIEFMSRSYNMIGVENFSVKDSQYIIVDSDFDATMSVEVLASAFNMDKADFLGHRILVDSFSDLDQERLNNLFKDDANYTALTDAEILALSNVHCVIVDKEFFKIVDNLVEFTEQYNAQGLYWNYWLHVWKTFSVSPFANAIVFVEGEPAISAVSVSPATANVAAGQQIALSVTVTTANFENKAVTWSLASVAPFPVITVGTDGASAGATTVPFAASTNVGANALIGRRITFGDATDIYTILGNTAATSISEGQITLNIGLADGVSASTTITPVADTGDAVPATVDYNGVVKVKPNAITGTSIIATATSVKNTSKSDSCTITVV